MTTKGKDLIFISRIERDGKSITEIIEDMKHVDAVAFNLNCLSITEGTYIAIDVNSYVVKLRPKEPEPDLSPHAVLDRLYQELLAAKLLTPEIKVIYHKHVNSYMK
jgi:hypothetical protein